MLPGYHVHFVPWSKNVSAARSVQWAQYLNLHNQTSIITQKEFYQNDISFTSESQIQPLPKDWDKKYFQRKTFFMQIWEKQEKSKEENLEKQYQCPICLTMYYFNSYGNINQEKKSWRLWKA